jgi:murein L,D-transpeptidase YcbB/YkuD
MLYPLVMVLLLFVDCPSVAADPASQDIRQFLEGIDAGAPPDVAGQRLHNPDRLSTLYAARDHKPLWTQGGPLAGQLHDLLRAIEDSETHGLNPRNYHLAVLQALTRGSTGIAEEESAIAVELLASDAFLQQARHRSSGAVAPSQLDPDWHLVPEEVDTVALLLQTADGNRPVEGVLASRWPPQAEYQQLVAERARILELGEERTVRVAPGPLLKPGQADERVVQLKERLLGPGEHTPVFDLTLRESVVEFQRSAGLDTDGMVGPGTLEVLNASRFSWIDRIDANLERWRWLPRRLPDTYLRVNIAAFTLRVVQHDHDALSMNVIVGRPYRRTPVFSEAIRYMVLNPYWNVPFKLAVEDKLPQLKKDPQMLTAQGFEVRSAGAERFVALDSVDWNGVTRKNFNYLLRQRPGDKNALGRLKIMLPNEHAVYLHDTPSRELFSKQERGFSSGCIRLAEPMVLADWILRNDGQADKASQLAQLIATAETLTLHLKTPLPTFLVYFTAFTDAAGTVVFRRDLYNRDAPIVAALRSGPTA